MTKAGKGTLLVHGVERLKLLVQFPAIEITVVEPGPYGSLLELLAPRRKTDNLL